MNRLKRAAPPPPPVTQEDVMLLREIRDSLKKYDGARAHDRNWPAPDICSKKQETQ
jgi:hypothetical protein